MALITRKKRPNARLDRFKELCAMGQTADEASKAVGFSESTGHKYRTKYVDEIKAMAAARFNAMAPQAIAALEKLLADKSGAVKLGAVNRILEGAELGITHRSEVTYFKSDADLDAELLEGCGGDPEKVKQILAIINSENQAKHLH